MKRQTRLTSFKVLLYFAYNILAIIITNHILQFSREIGTYSSSVGKITELCCFQGDSFDFKLVWSMGRGLLLIRLETLLLFCNFTREILRNRRMTF